MKSVWVQWKRWLACSMAVFALGAADAGAAIQGISGPNFSLTAKAGYISTADGQSLLAWGYANGDGTMQYPGPTLIVTQGDTVTVTLANQLPMRASIIFPGQQGVTATGGEQGLMTQEAVAGGAPVTYSFVAGNPGTYRYHSGTRPDLQVEMGLTGALIVRPAGAPKQAYGSGATAFDHEYLFMLTEIDPVIHEAVAGAMAVGATMDVVDTGSYFPVLWFLNGRNAPDTMAEPNLPWMPTQPYNCMPRAHPGEKVLLRIVGGGRDLHPFHTHGNNTTLIARDGRLLSSAPGAGPDLASSDYTITVTPGSTYDALFQWSGKGLGWDVYGHDSSDPLQPGEDPADHGKPLPVVLPTQLDLTNGAYWSGSPFLGTAGALPPGEGGFNANAGYFYMWHSHTEKELTNHNVFPGGMMTMFIVEPHGVPIP